MGKLDNIIDLINQEKKYLISVFDCDQGRHIYKYYPATSILEEFGTAENFFEDLNAKGHRYLNIQSHVKNGTGKKKIAEPLTVNFSDSEEEEEEIPTVAPISQPVAPVTKTESSFGNSFGLNAAEMMNLMVEKHEANRLRTDNAELKAENKRLKEQNEEFKEKLLADKYDFEKEKSKGQSTKELVNGLVGALPMVIEHLKPGQAQGLAAPQTGFDSVAKNNFSQILKELDDTTVTVLSTIVMAMDSNEEFSNDLIEILQKHNLWHK